MSTVEEIINELEPANLRARFTPIRNIYYAIRDDFQLPNTIEEAYENIHDIIFNFMVFLKSEYPTRVYIDKSKWEESRRVFATREKEGFKNIVVDKVLKALYGETPILHYENLVKKGKLRELITNITEYHIQNESKEFIDNIITKIKELDFEEKHEFGRQFLQLIEPYFGTPDDFNANLLRAEPYLTSYITQYIRTLQEMGTI